MDTIAARRVEFDKYDRAYRLPNYAMGRHRMADAVADLTALECSGGYLDVGCGRGEMLDVAEQLGYSPARGVEVVHHLIDGQRVEYAEGHCLPFASGEFEVVTMFDVIEHLLPGDDELTCKEIQRVASLHVLITANNRPSHNAIGEELHINIRPYEEWDALFREWFDQGQVNWLKDGQYWSHRWRVDFE